ncbi:MAG: pentapeptide repeat-containing protein [Cyanobium sp.]
MAGAELTPPLAVSVCAPRLPALLPLGLSTAPMRMLVALGSLFTLLLAPPVQAAAMEPLLQLLEQRSCRECQLQDADLVQADLRDTDLRRARLQRANLSGARLDGARLEGADLSFTSLQGASLRGADLRGARLEGTDLRSSDLSGAQLDPAALARSHWQGARGVPTGSLSYAALHNAGVDAFRRGQLQEAEQWFGAALAREPQAAITWVARAITRLEAGSKQAASQDLGYAASLYQAQGEEAAARQLIAASSDVLVAPPEARGGNGAGSHVLQGAFSALQGLAPLALKVLAGF